MARPLIVTSIDSPGERGLFTQNPRDAGDLIGGSNSALVANNIVFDIIGRLSARKGYKTLTTSALSGTPDIEQLFEYEKDKDTSFIISTATVSSAKKIYHGTSSLTDITGGVASVGNNWKFVNFNSKVVGVQQGEAPIVWTGTGNFADISAASGSVPTGNTACSVYGRLFVADANKTDIKYCASLDETHWATGGGTIDTKTYWPNGTDFIVALEEFNNKLVVFGRHSILIWDGMHSPSTSPAISDVIDGIGCIARDSIQSVGDDLIFLDDTGVRSLIRSIELKSQPLRDLSRNIRSDLKISIDTVTDKGKIKSAHNPVEGFYILIVPGSIDETWVFDTKFILPDQSARVTRWDNIIINSAYYSPIDEKLYFGGEGTIGEYRDYQDAGGSYTLDFEANWDNLGTTQYKVLKKIQGIFVGGASSQVNFKWRVDFEDSSDSAVVAIPASSLAVWGSGLWGTSKWGASDTVIRDLSVNATRTGRNVSFGMTVPINGEPFSIQKLDIIAKHGRVNR